MKASIIIPTTGARVNYLRDALASTQKQEFPADEYEILVVDNSKALVVQQIADAANKAGGHPVRCVKEEAVGLHHARHKGARESNGEILVYIDDDVVMPPGWLNALLRPFADSQVACCGGKVIPKWEAEVPSWYAQFKPSYLSLLDLGEKTIELRWSGAWGCNLAVRRSTLFEVGGFNPDGLSNKRLIWLRGDGECGMEQKLLDRGLKIIYVPEAYLHHRIPEHRLTPKYFYWRLFTEGISGSYMYLRKIQRSRLFVARVAYKIVFSFFQMTRYFLSAFFSSPDKSVYFRAQSHYWWGYCQHEWRSLFNSKLREHVLRDSYLDGLGREEK